MKKQITLLTVLSLFVTLHLFSQDRRTDKSVLTIATLNCEFLWDGVDPEEGTVNFPHKHSPTEAEDHMEKVAQIIKAKKPDIINLVEVENIEALTTFNNLFLQGLGYVPKLVKGKDNSTGQDVCMLTKIDPEVFKRTDNRATYNGTQSGVSKNYYATFTIGTLKLAIIGVHFVAFPNDRGRGNQREAQSMVIASLGDSLSNAGYKVIVLGDFNDYDGDLDCIDHQDNRPITTVLKRIKDLNTSTTTDDLVNICYLLPQNARYTAFWDKNQNNVVNYPGEFSSIDHILISNQLAEKIKYVEIPHNHDPIEVTDHYLVFASLYMDEPVSPTVTDGIRMIRAMPNPVGNENQEEYIVLKNFGSSAVNLKDWYFCDLAGRKWKFNNMSINANQELKVKRENRPMAMNNTSDAIELRNKDNVLIQSFSYSFTSEGNEILIP